MSRKPNVEDLDDGEVAVMTPEGSTWDAHDQNFANNERSLTNWKGKLHLPKYVHKEFVGEDDLSNINSIMVFDTVN